MADALHSTTPGALPRRNFPSWAAVVPTAAAGLKGGVAVFRGVPIGGASLRRMHPTA